MILLFVLLALTSPQWEIYKDKALKHHEAIQGWCSKKKAQLLMEFVHETEPSVVVEIGSFGGSTTFPLAKALAFNKKGDLYAIDAWDNVLAAEGFDPNSSHFSWWRTIDFASVKKGFIQMIRDQNLTKICHIYSMDSRQMMHQFADQSIDLLYLDGNFSPKGSSQDLAYYFPKIKSGGYIFLNDADSPYKKSSLLFLMNECRWIKSKSIGKECCCFQKY